MNCKRCGSSIEEGDLFCGECGWDVLKPYPETQPEAEKPGVFDSKPAEEMGDMGRSFPFPQVGSDEPSVGFSHSPIEGDIPVKREPYQPVTIDFPHAGDSNSGSKNKKPVGKKIALIASFVILLLFAVITILSITGLISISDIPFIKKIISEGVEVIETEDEETTMALTANDFGSNENQTIWAPSDNDINKQTKPVEDETHYGHLDDIPSELQPYADKLVVENRYYQITLEQSDWNIMYRSSPEVIDANSSNSNVISKIPDKTRIYVSYIYNGTWAVFRYDEHWGFSSLYAQNNPNYNTLMTPVG